MDLALVLAALAFLTGAALLGRIGKYIARLGFALSGALLFLGAAQTEMIMLEHPHGDAHSARALVDDIRAGNYLRQVFAD